MQSHTEKQVKLDLHSTKDSINQVADLLSDAFDQLGLDEEAVFDIRLAVQEAVVNAVEHGNRSDPNRMVHVLCQVDDDAITVTVTDEGDGFDPSAVPDPTQPENILREHGRGIFLMRNLCDDVRYNEKGNAVTMFKKLSVEED